ncbi:MAG: integrase, partial [Aliifodinibius sp.]|nr:integrase [Fodinibius sp.]
MLDEFCATAGYHRKAGIRKLNTINFRDPPVKKKHNKKFSASANALLIQVWEAYGHICGERLQPFLKEGLTILERCGYINESESVKQEVLYMSVATVKRRIADHKERMGKEKCKGLSSTKPGSLLKKQIPISTKCWDQEKAGYCEIDLVAH